MNKTLYIGIDPGSNTGIAIWHKPDKKLEMHQFGSHSEAMLFVHRKLNGLRPVDASTVQFRIEDARLTMKHAKKMPRHLLKPQHPGKIQGVGYVKAYSKDWEAFCVNEGYDHELLPPGTTKVSPAYFEAMTGIKTLKGQSHIRDAGMLVYGI